MKIIPSLFILGALATSSLILPGCGGGSSSGGVSIPRTNRASFTFTNIDAPAATNVSPLSAQGPFIRGSGIYADYFEGRLVTAAYESANPDSYRFVDIRRTTGTPVAPTVGTTYDLSAGGVNTLIYSFRLPPPDSGFSVSFEAISGRVTVVSKKGSFVTLRLENVVARQRFAVGTYTIRIEGTFTYDESDVPLSPTAARPMN